MYSETKMLKLDNIPRTLKYLSSDVEGSKVLSRVSVASETVAARLKWHIPSAKVG